MEDFKNKSEELNQKKLMNFHKCINDIKIDIPFNYYCFDIITFFNLSLNLLQHKFLLAFLASSTLSKRT